MKKNNQEKPKAHFYKKWWFWLIIGLGFLGIVGSKVGGKVDSSNSNIDENSGEQIASTYGMNQIVKVGDL